MASFVSLSDSDLFFFFKLWQEISEENRQVQEIVSTLENFQLEATPAKPSNHDDWEVRPVHVEQRYFIFKYFSFSAPAGVVLYNPSVAEQRSRCSHVMKISP